MTTITNNNMRALIGARRQVDLGIRKAGKSFTQLNSSIGLVWPDLKGLTEEDALIWLSILLRRKPLGKLIDLAFKRRSRQDEMDDYLIMLDLTRLYGVPPHIKTLVFRMGLNNG